SGQDLHVGSVVPVARIRWRQQGWPRAGAEGADAGAEGRTDLVRRAASLIAEDTTAQESVGLLADRADALELQFEIERGVVVAFDVVDPAARDQSPGDAAGVVLDAEEALEAAAAVPARVDRRGARVVQGVVLARDQAPARRQRDRRREVDLF